MRKIKKRKRTLPEKDLEQFKENLEKTGDALGDLFKGIFKGVGKILDIAQEMEEKGEEVRSYKKEIKGVTESGKEYRGEAGWRIGFFDALLGRKKKEKRRKRKKKNK